MVRDRFGVSEVEDALCFGGRDVGLGWRYLEEIWSVRVRAVEGLTGVDGGLGIGGGGDGPAGGFWRAAGGG